MADYVNPNPDKKLAPFVRFGAFDPSNYKPKELADAIAKEEKFQPIRMLEGDVLTGKISSFHHMGDNGEVMYLKDVSIVLHTDGGGKQVVVEGLVKMGTTPPDISWNLQDKKKGVGDTIKITYLGLKQSPKSPTRSLHKILME